MVVLEAMVHGKIGGKQGLVWHNLGQNTSQPELPNPRGYEVFVRAQPNYPKARQRAEQNKG